MDIITFLGKELGIVGKLAPSGWYRACCPIHHERSPSFAVYTEYPFPFKCLACGAKGQLPYLISVIRKIPLDEARTIVSEKLRIIISPKLFMPKRSVGFIPKSVVEAYAAAIPNSRTMEYCQDRGVPRFVLECFDVGHDQLQHRMLVPMRSLVTGKVVGFDTRGFLTTDEEVEKRSDMLYGAKSVSAITPRGYKSARNVIVVEGFFDAARVFMWIMNQCLDYTVVAFGGSSISEKQAEFLSQYDRIAIGLDLDAAGLCAANALSKRLKYTPLLQLLFDGTDPGESSLKSFRLALYLS